MNPHRTFATVFRTEPRAHDPDDANTADAHDGQDLDRTMDASLPSASAPRPVDLAAPSVETDARYGVQSVLGRGGMGEVRLCKDARIGREVAIKVAHVRAGDEDGTRARFLREARVQGQLEHPAIVPVYDLEVFADGSAYFAMKRVRGKTLAAILADLRRGDEEAARRFPLRKLLAALNSVCLAIDFAHEKGVIHRDIKPGNIMLGDYGEVYLLDWGLAKVVGQDDEAAVDAGAPGDDGATIAGSVLGTPGYMAPEQIDADLGALGPPTDVYALGAVLFEIVSLERYIDAPDVVHATIATLHGEEPRPSRRAARSVTPALDEVCARALAVRPADRYASARALHDAIDRHLAGEADLERRRAQSLLHLAASARRPDSVEGRASALRDLGSALALDPENGDARRGLVRLLTSAPAVVPEAVQARVREDERERVRQIAKLRATTGLAFVPFIPIMLLLGVGETAAFVLAFAAIALTSALNVALMRARAPGALHQLAAHAVFLTGLVFLGRIAGPLMILPALLVAYAVELQMHPDPRQRVGVLIASCAALAVAFGVERLGVMPPSYAAVDGGIMIHARMMALNDAALWAIFAASAAMIITPSVFTAKARAALARAEARLHLQAWQLAQIVPPDVPDAPVDARAAAPAQGERAAVG